jgi:5S rRNA maturation endonuclease (ribonuclease M5)
LIDTKDDIESLIRRYIPLGKRSPKGYEVVKCALCNDYKERGGFKFENDSVHYSCFNCSTSTGYNPEENRHSIKKKFKEVLLAFGIPESEIETCISFNFFKSSTSKPEVTEKKSNLEFPSKEIPLPHNSVLVRSFSSPWCDVADHYLKRRSLSCKDFDFYVTNETSYAGRLLIPYFFRGKIVFWQGRSLDDSLISPRYKNPSANKENIFFNMDEIYRHTTEPLFVVEGPLDAVSIGKNAIALTGSTLSEFRLHELKKVATKRKVIFVIDKNLNGYKLGQKLLKEEVENWFITMFPDNIDDSNDALQQLGRIWTVAHLTSTAVNKFQGKLALELNCSKT